jgi:hypothetical protein
MELTNAPTIKEVPGYKGNELQLLRDLVDRSYTTKESAEEALRKAEKQLKPEDKAKLVFSRTVGRPTRYDGKTPEQVEEERRQVNDLPTRPKYEFLQVPEGEWVKVKVGNAPEEPDAFTETPPGLGEIDLLKVRYAPILAAATAFVRSEAPARVFAAATAPVYKRVAVAAPARAEVAAPVAAKAGAKVVAKVKAKKKVGVPVKANRGGGYDYGGSGKSRGKNRGRGRK